MNSFEAFGIKAVSPSELKTFGQCRGQWFTKHIRKTREDAGPAAWRGDAVEAGVNWFLHGKGAPWDVAKQTFEQRATEWSAKHDGEVHSDYDQELAKIVLCLERAMEAFRDEPELADIGVPSSAQGKAEVLLPGAPVAIRGYWDWSFGQSGSGFTLDLKTSNSIPSKPEDGQRADIEPDHGIQFSLYAKARGESVARALYVSAKEYKTKPKAGEQRRVHQLVTLNENDIAFYISHAVQTMLSMEATLTAALAMTEYEFTTAEAALARLCRPNMLATGGGFYPIWRPEFARAAAEAVPEWGLY